LEAVLQMAEVSANPACRQTVPPPGFDPPVDFIMA